MAWMNESSLYVLVVLSFFILKVNAKQTCVTVNVRAEFFQQSLLESSVYEKRIHSSSSFRSNYNQLSVSAKVSGSFKLFSASVQASYERVTSSVSQFSQNEHTEKSESLTFNSDFLQIVRKITTGVTIGGSTAQTEIRELVDSVDKTKPKTDSQLRKLETEYITRYFGNVSGHTYTETKCIDYEVSCYTEPTTSKDTLECANGKLAERWNGCIDQGSYRVRCPKGYSPCNELRDNGKEFKCGTDCSTKGGKRSDCIEELSCYTEPTTSDVTLECANGKLAERWDGCIDQGSYRVRCPKGHYPCNNFRENGKEFYCHLTCSSSAHGGKRTDCIEG